MNILKHKTYRFLLMVVAASALLVSCGEKTIPVTDLKLYPEALEMVPGSSEVVIAAVFPSNATDQAISWSSSASDVVTVDGNGTLQALKAGNAVITARCGGMSATCQVKVTVPVEDITLNQYEVAIWKGGTFTLTATVNPPDATDKTVTWESSASRIVSVDSNGNLKTLSGGTATVTALCGGKSASCKVTVDESTSGGNEGTGRENWD